MVVWRWVRNGKRLKKAILIVEAKMDFRVVFICETVGIGKDGR
jgi:hypothetical protein